jgi:hypothetical protein
MSAATVLDIPVGPLIGPVLGRVVRFHCARADLEIDRLSDAVLITDALAAGIEDVAIDGRVRFVVEARPGCVGLNIGPLTVGGARRFVDASAVDQLGPVLGTLADAFAPLAGADGDHLTIEIRSRHRG